VKRHITRITQNSNNLKYLTSYGPQEFDNLTVVGTDGWHDI